MSLSIRKDWPCLRCTHEAGDHDVGPEGILGCRAEGCECHDYAPTNHARAGSEILVGHPSAPSCAASAVMGAEPDGHLGIVPPAQDDPDRLPGFTVATKEETAALKATLAEMEAALADAETAAKADAAGGGGGGDEGAEPSVDGTRPGRGDPDDPNDPDDDPVARRLDDLADKIHVLTRRHEIAERAHRKQLSALDAGCNAALDALELVRKRSESCLPPAKRYGMIRERMNTMARCLDELGGPERLKTMLADSQKALETYRGLADRIKRLEDDDARRSWEVHGERIGKLEAREKAREAAFKRGLRVETAPDGSKIIMHDLAENMKRKEEVPDRHA